MRKCGKKMFIFMNNYKNNIYNKIEKIIKL